MSLRIDFAPAKTRTRPLALHLGMFSASLALACGLVWSMTGETVAGLTPPAAEFTAEKTSALNQAIDDLNFPWLEVLALLEENSSRELRFSQLAAEPRTGLLALQGEARDSRSILTLPQQLRRNPLVSEARILSQSSADNAENTAYPQRFALELQISPPTGR